MKKLTSNLRGHYKELILGPLFKLLEAIFELCVPLIMAAIIDNGIQNANAAYVLKGGALLVVLAVLGGLAGCTCQYFASVAAFGFGASLRSQVFGQVLRFSGRELDQLGTGSLVTRITNDVNQVQNGVNMFIRLATRSPFLAIGSIVMAFTINARIALVFLLSTPLIVLVLYGIMRATLPRYSEIQQGQDTLSALAGENLEGARVIRAFSRQASEKQGFSAAGRALSAVTVAVGRVSGALNPITYVIANLGVLLILWLGARSAQAGLIASGEIIALVNYMTQTLLALIVLANLIVQFTRAIASARRLAALLDMEPAVSGPVEGLPAQSAPAGGAWLAFENVNFAYTPGRNALTGVSFCAQKGQTLGVIGGTGSGKSTLAGLILRFYDVTGGRILLNGQDIRACDPAALRAKVGYVPQAVQLFSGTIRSNLALGCRNAGEEELWAALKLAQGEEFVRQKPQGLDSPVEEGGKNFSGGQRQRLTIARALASRPELLILDDASSALDFATDAALRRALRRHAAGMTVMMISQRASSIKNADLILVLDDGMLAAQGTHEQLLQTCPVYREICISQKLVDAPTAERPVKPL